MSFPEMNDFVIPDAPHNRTHIDHACDTGNSKLFRYLICTYKDQINYLHVWWHIWIKKACELNQSDIVQFILDQNSPPHPDFELVGLLNTGLNQSCLKHHDSLIALLIEKGANDWNKGLISACEGGHIDLVQDMITRGADDWNSGLGKACVHGHRHVVHLMIEKGATDFNYGLVSACRGGHLSIVQDMIDKEGNDWYRAFYFACYFGHSEIVKLLMLQDSFEKPNWNCDGKRNWKSIWSSRWCDDRVEINRKIFLFEHGVTANNLDIGTHDEWCWFLNHGVDQSLGTPPSSVFQKRTVRQQIVFHTIQCFIQQTNLQHFSKAFVLPCFPFE